jgi:hypothetical protein
MSADLFRLEVKHWTVSNDNQRQTTALEISPLFDANLKRPNCYIRTTSGRPTEESEDRARR